MDNVESSKVELLITIYIEHANEAQQTYSIHTQIWIQAQSQIRGQRLTNYYIELLAQC